MTTTIVPDQTAGRWLRAVNLWAEYQRTHDITHLEGQAVGIDPDTGEVFFGESVEAVQNRPQDEGRSLVLYVTRVARPHRHNTRLRRL